MIRIVIILSFLLNLNSLNLSGQSTAEKIDRLMTAYYRNEVFTGTVLVSKNGEIIYKKAFGPADREWNTQITTDTKFKIASISKSFTALLVLQLAEEGKLNLESTILDYIPDYKGKDGNSITIHQLLTHTAGIMTSLNPDEEAVQERLHHSLREMVRFAESADLYFKPGTGFRYSNLAYNILACIVESVTGKTFEYVLKEKILDPAGLMNTKHYKNANIENRIAKGYEYKLLSGFVNASDYDDSYPVGPGSLISTVDDLYLLDQALYTNQLISERYKTMMFTPASTGNYGYGWFITRRKINQGKDSILIADHSGSINGFGSYIARILTDSSLVIILKNQRSDSYIDPAFAPDIGNQIITILYGADVDIPAKSIARHIASRIGREGVDSAIAEYKRAKRIHFSDYSFRESELNKLGIELYFKYKMADEALKIFEVNMQEFPKSYNTYDSYAFILMEKGDYTNSILYYRKGLEILVKYPEANDLNSVKKDADQALVYIKDMQEKLKPGSKIPK
jgi:CubicO group peptidase (beta-lactamase class C family)